jgi:hypothetical protein
LRSTTIIGNGSEPGVLGKYFVPGVTNRKRVFKFKEVLYAERSYFGGLYRSRPTDDQRVA